MKRCIMSADAIEAEDMLKETISQLEDDFDYAVDGIAKLAADGDTATAQAIAEDLAASVDSIIKQVSGELVAEVDIDENK